MGTTGKKGTYSIAIIKTGYAGDRGGPGSEVHGVGKQGNAVSLHNEIMNRQGLYKASKQGNG